MLLALTTLLAVAARAAQIPIDPIPAARMALAAATMPPELAVMLGHSREARWELVRLRCERSLLDFVELMWPVVDPGQPFVRGRVQEAIAMHLEAVTFGKIKNLLANVPPGSTKTYLVNVFWPAWEWGPRNRPDLRYMAWSYSPELAAKANDDCRRVIKHEVYQRFWGKRFSLDLRSDAKTFYLNDKGGWRRSSSIKGAATGFRADRLIWDDPHNVKDADSPAELKTATRWFARTLPTRVRQATKNVDVKVPWWVRDVHNTLDDDPNDQRPVIATSTVGIMQRVALHDISGIILKNPALGYEILLIEMRYKGASHPARKLDTWPKSSIGYEDWRTEYGQLADPVRQPEEEVARLEAQMISDGGGADAIAAQLDQWPIEIGGSLFKDEWLPVIDPGEVPDGADRRGWDFAGSKHKKADQTATAVVRRGADKRFYLMSSDAIRGGPGAVDKFIEKYHKLDAMSVIWSIPQDPGPAGKQYVAYVKRYITAGRVVHSSTEKGKEKSAKPVSSQAEHGNFIIVRHKGWEVTRSQLIDFPYGDHDDLVDAISRAFGAHVIRPDVPEAHGGMGGFVDGGSGGALPAELGDESLAGIIREDGSVRDFDF